MLRSLLFLPLWAALASCVSYRPQPLHPAAAGDALTQQRLSGKVWTLSALAAEAARRSPEVRVARAQYETARAALRTAGERPNPTVALTPQVVTPYTALIAGTYGVDFDWTVETAGKRSRRVEVAQANQRAAAARVVEASWKARAAVRQALLELYAAESRARLLADAVARQDEVLRSLDARIQAGAESRAIFAQPRLLQTQLRLQAADAGRGGALARAAVAAALGLSIEAIKQAHFSFAAFEHTPSPRGSHRRAALTHRADILAALADYASAEASLRLEVARQYPDIHLQPGYQLDAGQNKWGLGLGITLPILNQNRGAIGEAEAKRREAAARFDSVQAKALGECDRAAASVAAARQKLSVAEQMYAEQAKQIQLEERQLAAGAEDKLGLLNARVERSTIEIARLESRVELLAAIGALEEATQSPLEK